MNNLVAAFEYYDKNIHGTAADPTEQFTEDDLADEFGLFVDPDDDWLNLCDDADGHWGGTAAAYDNLAW